MKVFLTVLQSILICEGNKLYLSTTFMFSSASTNQLRLSNIFTEISQFKYYQIYF